MHNVGYSHFSIFTILAMHNLGYAPWYAQSQYSRHFAAAAIVLRSTEQVLRDISPPIVTIDVLCYKSESLPAGDESGAQGAEHLKYEN
jgi:hypothetical protein